MSTGNVKLWWKVSKQPDSFNVYHALAPFEKTALPAPVASGLAANMRQYIHEGQKKEVDHYYRIASVKDGKIYPSRGIKIKAKPVTEYIPELSLSVLENTDWAITSRAVEGAARTLQGTRMDHGNSVTGTASYAPTVQDICVSIGLGGISAAVQQSVYKIVGAAADYLLDSANNQITIKNETGSYGCQGYNAETAIASCQKWAAANNADYNSQIEITSCESPVFQQSSNTIAQGICNYTDRYSSNNRVQYLVFSVNPDTKISYDQVANQILNDSNQGDSIAQAAIAEVADEVIASNKDVEASINQQFDTSAGTQPFDATRQTIQLRWTTLQAPDSFSILYGNTVFTADNLPPALASDLTVHEFIHDNVDKATDHYYAVSAKKGEDSYLSNTVSQLKS